MKKNMKIKLTEILNFQSNFDKFIDEVNKVNRADIRKKLHLAMMAELMELCNETRCFNYWSDKKRGKDEEVLSEFADVLSFCLSEGIEYYNLMQVEEIEINEQKIANNDELTNCFILLIDLFNQINDLTSLIKMLKTLLELGLMLGYNFDTLINAYYKKCNKVRAIQKARYEKF